MPMNTTPGSEELDPWIIELSLLPDAAERRSFLNSRPHLHSLQAVEDLYNAVVAFARVDVDRAERAAEASGWIAGELDDPGASAQSARASGHVFYLRGKYRLAIQEYERALAGFERLGRDLDVA